MAEKEIIIRKAKIKDAENLIVYCNLVGGESDFLTFGRDEFGTTVEEERDFIRKSIDSEVNLSLIALYNDKIIGNLNFRGNARKRLAHGGEFGISVAREFWGMGIGEKLIALMLDWINKNRSIKKINLQVLENNIRAIGLYEKMGFVKEGRISKKIYLDGKYYDSILMGLFIE